MAVPHPGQLATPALDVVKVLLAQSYFGHANRPAEGLGELFREKLGLKRTPHFTTPQKVLARIKAAWLNLLLRRLGGLLKSLFDAITDATWWRQRAASTHYLHRLGERIEARDNRKSVGLLEEQLGIFLTTKGRPGHNPTAEIMHAAISALRTVP